MSISVSRPTLGWKLLPVVLAATASVSLAGLALEAFQEAGPEGAPTPTQPAVPDLSHAPWRTDLFPVGAAGPLTKEQRGRFESTRETLRPVVRNAADAVAFSEGELRPWVADLFTPDALKAMKGLRLGMPAGAVEIEALARRARIGIQAPSFRAAAGRVRVDVQATVGRRVITWRDTMTLWFERAARGSWRVIAFDIDRERQP